MNGHNYAMSICIPTFNRIHYLKESLDILLPQAQRLGVEVCVSDNHSEDATVGYLAEMSGLYSCLRYIVQGKNIGLDKNMAAAISMGRGRYIYPLGDDDVLPEGSVSAILKEFDEDRDIDVIILNGWHTDPVLSQIMMHLTPDLQGRQFFTPEAAFATLWDKMPFGSFLASRNCFSPKYFDRFMGTSHAYTGAVWDMLAESGIATKKCKIKCMLVPTVLLRGAEKTWRHDAAHILLCEIPKWFGLMADSYQEIITPILSNYLKLHLHNFSLLHYRAIGQLDNELATELKSMLPINQYYKVKCIANIPKFFAWSCCKSLSIVIRIHKCMR